MTASASGPRSGPSVPSAGCCGRGRAVSQLEPELDVKTGQGLGGSRLGALSPRSAVVDTARLDPGGDAQRPARCPREAGGWIGFDGTRWTMPTDPPVDATEWAGPTHCARDDGGWNDGTRG